jgi:hypothetical protein
MINTKNQITEYHTGDEFHVDYTLAQYLSKELGFALVGYYYQQITDDESPTLDEVDAANRAVGLPTYDGFKSKGAAVGPAIMYTPKIGGKDVNFIRQSYPNPNDDKGIPKYYALFGPKVTGSTIAPLKSAGVVTVRLLGSLVCTVHVPSPLSVPPFSFQPVGTPATATETLRHDPLDCSGRD